MDESTLEDLLVKLRSFADRQIDRETLRRWFLPYHAAPVLLQDCYDVDGLDSWSPEQTNKALFWHVIWLLEGDATEERHRDLARRIAACYSGLRDPATVLELLPLIVARERFCSIVMKYRLGIVSRIGLLSVIGKTFTWELEIRGWLTAASLENLEALCRLLEADEYSAVVTQLSLPSA